MYIDNLTVIIRSVGERTTDLCQKLILEQKEIFIIFIMR